MILTAIYLLGACMTMAWLRMRDDGTADEPLYIVVSSLIWPLFWLAVAVLFCWYAWVDRKYWWGK